VHEGVEVLEVFAGGGDERAPLIVAIHGRGDRPENWVDDWSRFPVKAQIALPRAFDRFGEGFSWFELHPGMSDAELGASVGAAETRLWRAIAHLAGGRRVVVTGFSQGGILSYAMAAQHPDAVLAAFPVAGACPGPLLPKDKSRAAPVVGFHGTADDIIPVKWARETVKAFQQSGNKAELHEYDGVGHQVTREIHASWWAAVQRALG
jgi:phospholipase/carboxylesterase